jgi:hypothetical protein
LTTLFGYGVLILGSVGSNNNVYVMDISSLIGNLINDRGMGFHLVLMVQMYSRYDLLADGIYPNRSCLAQTNH